eukprot:414698-Rhodomonas_salina.1
MTRASDPSHRSWLGYLQQGQCRRMLLDAERGEQREEKRSERGEERGDRLDGTLEGECWWGADRLVVRCGEEGGRVGREACCRHPRPARGGAQRRQRKKGAE